MDKSKQVHTTTAPRSPPDYSSTDGSRVAQESSLGPDSVRKPVNDEAQNVDHHARIGELAVQLRNASPSGANTISDKILFHLDAIASPKDYEAKVAADKKAEDKIEAQRAKEREQLKTPADQNAKVA